MQVLVLKSYIKLMNVNTYITYIHIYVHMSSSYRKMAWPKKRRYESSYDDAAKRSFSLAREEEICGFEAIRNFGEKR